MVKKKNDKFFLFSSIFFIFISFIKGSTTLLIGISASIIVVMFFRFKKIPKLTKIIYFIILVFSLYSVYSTKECKSRFVPSYFSNDMISPKISETVKKTLSYSEPSGSITAAIYFHSFRIAFKSIVYKPLGWGLNRYEDAFIHFNKLDPPILRDATHDKVRLQSYNTKDGGNNLAKIIVEFGIFGIIFYFFLIKFLISKNINTDLIIFLIPIIITQSIRGAGYFNGGFSLIALLMIFSYINSIKK